MRIMEKDLSAVTTVGNYSMAALEYAGLLSSSYLKRGKATAEETGKYSLATIEYAGLTSYSLAKRGGSTVKICAVKASIQTGRAVSTPFIYTGHKVGAVLKWKGGRFNPAWRKNIDQRVANIEDRMDTLERYGIRTRVGPVSEADRSEIGEDKRAILLAIVEENKLLMSEIKDD